MNCTEGTLSPTAMFLPGTRNYAQYGPVSSGAFGYFFGSEDLNRLIDEDLSLGGTSSSTWDDEEMFIPKTSDPWSAWKEIVESPLEGIGTSLELDLAAPFEDDSDRGDNRYMHLSSAYTVLVNPRTGTRVTQPISFTAFDNKPLPQVSPKPYHPIQDHDYLKQIKEEYDDDSVEETSGMSIVEEIFKREDEPVVEVWEIDNFCKELPATDPVPGPSSSYRQKVKKEPRRKSARTADIRRREQAQKISNAVHAVLKNEKAQRTRQYKNIKPKNSVETTPSQSDIEEWYTQPVRPTYTKITKKKTTKGRIDHSESERHRREVLRTNFSSLCNLIPNEYLRGEKASSQISKQKILNGAKAYIEKIYSTKSFYKSLYRHNKILREKWQKRHSARLLKCVKRHK